MGESAARRGAGVTLDGYPIADDADPRIACRRAVGLIRTSSNTAFEGAGRRASAGVDAEVRRTVFGTREEIEAELQRLADQFEELLVALRRARAAQCDRAGEGASHQAAVIALGAVLEFLTWMPEVRHERLDEPLAALRNALQDRRREVGPALLERPADRVAREDGAVSLRVPWVAAACAMQLLMKAGLSRREAVSEVAGMLDRAGCKLGRGDATLMAQAVAQWRDTPTREMVASRAVEQREPRAVPATLGLPGELFDAVRKMPVVDAAHARKAAAALIGRIAGRSTAA